MKYLKTFEQINEGLRDKMKGMEISDAISKVGDLNKGEINNKFFKSVSADDVGAANVYLEMGANVNHVFNDIMNNDFFTPIILAIENESPDMVELLLNFGSDPNIKDGDGLSAFNLAKKYDNKRILELLNKKGNKPPS